MRRLIFSLGAAFFSLGAAIFSMAPARAADCAGVTFADMPWLRFGKPAGASASGGKLSAARGEILALGASSGAQVCAEKVRGQGAGWLQADTLAIVPRINDTGSFVGSWRHGANVIRITWQEDGRLTVQGTGAGAFSGDMDMRDGIGLYFGDGVDPDTPEAPGCRLRMARGGDILLVRGNGQCGGALNGTFTHEKDKAVAR